MVNKSRLGLAGLLLAGAVSILAPRLYADSSATDSHSQKPKVVATFNYKSERAGHVGELFRYNLWSNDMITEADNSSVRFFLLPSSSSKWFYDINNDGQFGKAEKSAIRNGIPIYMSQTFDRIANAELKKTLSVASAEKPAAVKPVLEQKVSAPVQTVKQTAKPMTTEEYLLEKSKEMGWNYNAWFESLNTEDQQVFTTFAEGMINAVDSLPANEQVYAKDKFEKLLRTGNVNGIYEEITKDVSNLPPEQRKAFMEGLTSKIRILDHFLKEHPGSVERISYSLRDSPPQFGQIENLYINKIDPLAYEQKSAAETTSSEKISAAAPKPVAVAASQTVSKRSPAANVYVPKTITDNDVINYLVQLEPELNQIPSSELTGTKEVIENIVKFYNSRTEQGKEQFMKRIGQISDWYKTLSQEEKMGVYDFLSGQ